MSYTYLQALGEESSAECFSDIPLSALSKSKSIQERCYSNGNETESSHDSPSGMTCRPSTGNRGEGKSISSAVDSRAKTLAAREKEPVSTESEAGCGERWQELPARFDLVTSSWKTHLCLWEEDLPESSVILPRCGIARNGVCSELGISELGISVKDSGWWLPTICKSESKGSGRSRWRGSLEYRGAKMSEGLRTCREDPIYLTVSFGEIAMGFPLTWTGLQPLETRSFRKWQQQHSSFCLKQNART